MLKILGYLDLFIIENLDNTMISIVFQKSIFLTSIKYPSA